MQADSHARYPGVQGLGLHARDGRRQARLQREVFCIRGTLSTGLWVHNF